VASGILLVVQAISSSWTHSPQDVTAEVLVPLNEETHLNRFGSKLTQYARNHGGLAIFGFKIAQLIGCLTLFSLSLATLLLNSVDSTHQKVMWDWGRIFLADNLPQMAMAITFVRLIIKIFHIVC
jgi:hypothetical protein